MCVCVCVFVCAGPRARLRVVCPRVCVCVCVRVCFVCEFASLHVRACACAFDTLCLLALLANSPCPAAHVVQQVHSARRESSRSAKKKLVRSCAFVCVYVYVCVYALAPRCRPATAPRMPGMPGDWGQQIWAGEVSVKRQNAEQSVAKLALAAIQAAASAPLRVQPNGWARMGEARS